MPVKARTRKEAKNLEDIPNVGKKVAEDLRFLGIQKPEQLANKDPFKLYDSLCEQTMQTIDPCMLDVFMAAVDFMNGAKAMPWWAYTAKRKEQYKI